MEGNVMNEIAAIKPRPLVAVPATPPSIGTARAIPTTGGRGFIGARL